MLERLRQKELEQIVVDMLEDYGLTTYPMSIQSVAHKLGIKLAPYSSLDERTRELALNASSDAFTVTDVEYSSVVMAFNDMKGSNFYRSRFSGAHEIGHIVLDHREDDPTSEAEADYFAGYLLTPHPLILTMPEGESVSERFGVSSWCADFARDQAQRRCKEKPCWEPHEKWLLDNAEWKGGGLIGRA